MFQNANFLGSAPDPAGGAYIAPPDALADSEGARTSIARTLPRSEPFGPLFYRSVGLTHHRVAVAARGFLPPGANVCVAAPSSQIGS